MMDFIAAVMGSHFCSSQGAAESCLTARGEIQNNQSSNEPHNIPNVTTLTMMMPK